MSHKALNFPMVLDGGLSNVLEDLGCDLSSSLWTAELLEKDPQAIVETHLRYLRSGADIISTTGYQASIKKYLELSYSPSKAEELILRPVALARQALKSFVQSNPDKKRFIAASIGPFGAYLADGSEYTGDYEVGAEQLRSFHKRRLRLLADSSADFLAFETMPNALEIEVISDLLSEVTKPSWLSLSVQDANSLRDGTPLPKIIQGLDKLPNLFAIGVNCCAPSIVEDCIKTIRLYSDKKVIVYPNSGQVYDAKQKKWLGTSDPLQYGQLAEKWFASGADIVGGCCQIGPRHIENIKRPVP